MQIFIVVEGNTETLTVITAGASRFLIVTFQTLGHVVVDDIAHIRLVNTHTKSDGGHNHVCFLHQEVILVLNSGLGVQTGMVRQCANLVNLQKSSQFFHLFTTQAVYNARFARMVLNELHHLFIDIFRLFADFIIEVGTVEGGNEHFGLFHSQILLDIALHLGCCGGSQCNYWHFLTDFLDNGTDASVFRAEIMSPFRNTVRFIDSIKRDVYILEKLDILLFGKRFRSHIQQFCLPFQQILFHFVDFHFGEGGIEEVGNAVLCAKATNGIHLVLHQGNQGGNHNSRALLHHGRQLVAHRLSTARGHNHEAILAFQERLDNLQLITFEFVKTEYGFQRLMNLLVCKIFHLQKSVLFKVSFSDVRITPIFKRKTKIAKFHCKTIFFFRI